MSAITGLYQTTTKPVIPDLLQPALAELACYASDDMGVWTDGPVGFGARLSRLTSKSQDELQPVTYQHLTVVSDARIDNRNELIHGLGILPAHACEIPDSRLILHAWDRWGEACVPQLIGDFSFAVWDARSRTLFLARDHIGARPLYYYQGQGVFAFASDMRALLAYEEVLAEVDELEIGRLLLSNRPAYYDPHTTYLKNLFKLPFGCQLRINAQNVHLTRHWPPDDLTDLRLPSDEAYVEALQPMLEEAVRCRLPTVQPVGAHLSGGLDSSAVAVVTGRICRERNQPFHVYSWAPPPDGEVADRTEHQRIDAVCRTEGWTPHFVDAPLEQADLDFMDPDYDPVTRPRIALDREQHIQKAAHAHGVRLMLSGWGGDEFISFNGRGHLIDQFARGHWFDLLKNLRGAESRWYAARAILYTFWREVALYYLPPTLHHRWCGDTTSREPVDRFMQAEFESRIRSLIIPESPITAACGTRASQRALYLNGHLTQRMESWAGAGAERAITYAYPLTDRRLMTFALQLPGDMYWKNGWRRYLFRLATERNLPAGMTWNRMGEVKDDAVLQQAMQGSRGAYTFDTKGVEGKSVSPWVDTNRLSKIMQDHQNLIHPAMAMPIRRAVEATRIWQRWLSED